MKEFCVEFERRKNTTPTLKFPASALVIFYG